MSWPHPILTDSGGFQVFSLSDLRKVTDEGVTFRSHIDGSEHFLSPEIALEVEMALGADIIMVLDECIEAPAGSARSRRGGGAHAGLGAALARIFFASTAMPRGKCFSGSFRAERMLICAAKMLTRSSQLDFPGYAIGGLAVGEPHEVTCAMTAKCRRGFPRIGRVT